MTQASTQFKIGAEVSCSDGAGGKLSRAVVDPLAKAVAHLVVEPEGHDDVSRLAPLDLVTANDGEITLTCTVAGLHDLQPAEETEFLPEHAPFGGFAGYDDYGLGQAYYWPYYGLGTGAGGAGLGLGMGGAGLAGGGLPRFVTYETVPLGDVDLRRGEHVRATDGEIGKVEGLVIEPTSRHITHVLLQEGHLWGRKQVAIPISAVVSVEDGIELTLAKQEVEDLPPVDLDHAATSS
ncbi:MAG TPA: PRC-barrel domain-containing protein [Acidimicrobiales bacterium]|nr:PRC-barrel domain-containing protein [Acidimicrobiales bacterium]